MNYFMKFIFVVGMYKMVRNLLVSLYRILGVLKIFYKLFENLYILVVVFSKMSMSLKKNSVETKFHLKDLFNFPYNNKNQNMKEIKSPEISIKSCQVPNSKKGPSLLTFMRNSLPYNYMRNDLVLERYSPFSADSISMQYVIYESFQNSPPSGKQAITYPMKDKSKDIQVPAPSTFSFENLFRNILSFVGVFFPRPASSTWDKKETKPLDQIVSQGDVAILKKRHPENGSVIGSLIEDGISLCTDNLEKAFIVNMLDENDDYCDKGKRIRFQSECSSSSSVLFEEFCSPRNYRSQISTNSDEDDIVFEEVSRSTKDALSHILGYEEEFDDYSDDDDSCSDYSCSAISDDEADLDIFLPVGGLIVSDCLSAGMHESDLFMQSIQNRTNDEVEASVDEVDSSVMCKLKKDDNKVSCNEASPEYVKDANQRWLEICANSVLVKSATNTPKSVKKVKFSGSESPVTDVFYIPKEDRKGIWETYPINRCRFKRRVDQLSEILSPILDPLHRQKIYRTAHDSAAESEI